MKKIFYFIRDTKNKPVISVCLLLTTHKTPMIVEARGVAICSDRDTPCTKLNAHQSNGPGIARRRAWKAWKNEKNMYEIFRDEPIAILDLLRATILNWTDVAIPLIYSWKAFYRPILSQKEQRILMAIT